MPDEWGVVKRGYIDRGGKLVVPAKYDKTFAFSGGLGRVAIGKDQMRLIDKSGKIVIPATWSFARQFHGPLAPVVEGRQSAWIDINGKVVWRSG